MTRPRTVDPDVARCRASVAGLASQKAPAEAVQRAREDLDTAKRLAAIKAAVRNAPPLTPEVRDAIVGLLHSVGDR